MIYQIKKVYTFCRHEGRVYLKLLEIGDSNARAISKSSEVPYGRIYNVLRNLENLGILNKDSGRPQNFSAVEPETAISRLLEIKRQEMENITKEANLVTQKLSQIYESKPKDKLVWKVAIGDELHKSYFNLLTEARREFLGYFELTQDMIDTSIYIDDIKVVIRKLEQRKVKIRILLGIDNMKLFNKFAVSHPELLEIFNSVNIKLTGFLPYPFTVIDGQKVLLKVINPSKRTDFLAAVYLWEDSLAKSLKDQFEKLWKSASPLKISVKAL